MSRLDEISKKFNELISPPFDDREAFTEFIRKEDVLYLIERCRKLETVAEAAKHTCACAGITYQGECIPQCKAVFAALKALESE